MAADQLKLLLQIPDSDKQIDVLNKVNELEKIGNNSIFNIYSILNRLYIVPFDREDINKLTNTVDKVLEYIIEITRKVHFYQLGEPILAYGELADFICQATREIGICFSNIRDMNKGKKQIMVACETLSQLNKKADEVFYSEILILFSTDAEMTCLSKKKEILEALKKCLGETKNVAKEFKRILIKAS
jgi:uncharacterized protein Yka (UPF0111/DUF47 family)